MPKLPTATALACALLIGALSLLSATQAAASQGVSYIVKPVCSAPLPGHAACLGLRLERIARKSGESGVSPAVTPARAKITPEKLHSAYQLPTEETLVAGAQPQTIVLVDAYDDPDAEADLGVYDTQHALPTCTHADGCFTKVNQQGASSPLPAGNGEWSEEIATDIEVAHSLCQNCHIVLVEATTDTFPDLEAAEDTAAALLTAASPSDAPTGEISNSWGGEEPEAGSPDSSAFNHPGIVIAAAAGDAGYLNWDEYTTKTGTPYFDGADYPASSPHVVAVGGTSLTIGPAGEWTGENVWNDEYGSGGGGCSADFAAASWQSHTPGWANVGCGAQRAVADVSADADPNTGVEVYDSVPEGLGTPEEKPGETAPEGTGELIIGGTSVASPIIASTFALAGGAQGVAYPAATLYAHAGSAGLHDIVAGGNGKCQGTYTSCTGSMNPLSSRAPLDCGEGVLICNAALGYDGPTGVGTPNGLTAFQPVPGEIGGPQEESPAEGPHGGSGPGAGGPGGGSSGGGSGGTTNPGGSVPVGSAPRTLSGPLPGSTAKPPAKARPRIVLTRLSLTLSAVIALNHSSPALSTIAFTFAISKSAKVRMTLARRVRVHGHWRWSALPGSNSITARAGTNHGHLSGRGTLPSGLYRLTLTPAGGVARSLSITIG